MTGTEASPSFRLGYVPGVTPGKWVRTWSERQPDVPLELVALAAGEAEQAVREDRVDGALLRLPVDRTGLSAIPLYTETTVVIVPKDHEIGAVDEVSLGDLADYVVLHPLDDCLEWAGGRPPGEPAKERPDATADAVELVAAGVGLLLAPQSLARLHHRRDLTYRELAEEQAPQSRVALAWLEDRTTDLMEEFIGIVRGRTANSSRGRPAEKARSEKVQSKQGKPQVTRGRAAQSGRKQPQKQAQKPRRRG